ncbi:MAG: hypothetical protein GY698_25145, partial [Actinomycetia bacterium]|nr:hypothetical protein [Actinomycetes bacterium]
MEQDELDDGDDSPRDVTPPGSADLRDVLSDEDEDESMPVLVPPKKIRKTHKDKGDGKGLSKSSKKVQKKVVKQVKSIKKAPGSKPLSKPKSRPESGESDDSSSDESTDEDDFEETKGGRKKVTYPLDHDTAAAFVDHLKNHPCLFHSGDKDYYKTEMKRNLWKEITTELGYSEKHLRGWLRSKRTRLGKLSKLMSGSGHEVPPSSEDAWILVHMPFVLGYIKRKRRTVKTAGGLKSSLKRKKPRTASLHVSIVRTSRGTLRMEPNPESELVIDVDPATPGAILEEDFILEPTCQQVPETPRQQVAEAPMDPPAAEDGIAHLRHVALETTPTGLPTLDADDDVEARRRAIQVATRVRPKGARTRLTNVEENIGDTTREIAALTEHLDRIEERHTSKAGGLATYLQSMMVDIKDPVLWRRYSSEVVKLTQDFQDLQLERDNTPQQPPQTGPAMHHHPMPHQ